MCGQLLDNTQVSGVSGGIDTGTEVDGNEDADELSPTKARRQGDFRKKPLPATYEPGTLPPPAVTEAEVYTGVLFFSEFTHSHIIFTRRQADLRLAQTQERLCRWRRG